MKVTENLIDHLAHLARLHFNNDEKAEIKQDLERMITFVEKLQEVDTTGVEPAMHMSDEFNVLREDEAEHTISREEALKNAPITDGVYFKVPKVIKK